MSVRRTHVVAIVLLTALVLPLFAACGGAPSPAGEANNPASSSGSQPTEAAEPVATTAPAQPASGGDPQSRTSGALNLLTGSSSEASVFPSYRIEIKGTSPVLDWESKEVKTSTTDLTADVQGGNVHMFFVDDDGETVEAYLIEDGDETKEYEVKDGVPQETILVSMAWVSWPLGVIVPLSLAAVGAQPAGSEAIEGRAADVYDVSMANADPAALEIIQSMIGRGYSEARGKVWVDQQTGGLLKTVLDWEEDVYDATSGDTDAPPVGHGSGHYEVVVSQVGGVSVGLPQ